jgi:transposase
VKPKTDSWRVDETSMKVKKQWVYLSRAVDSRGNTLDFFFSPKRDATASKAFLLKTLTTSHTNSPRVITVDVLPDRTADTSAAWMAVHPEIELVSRDRGGDYASAATDAPQAKQCADLFQLLANLGKALEGVLSRHLAAHRHAQRAKAMLA